MRSHAANPIAWPLGGDRFRVYFGARDEHQRSSVGFVEIDLGRPREVLALSPEPALTVGERGAFDDSGVSPGDLVRVGDRLLLYYVGWNLGRTVPFRNSIGLAASADGRRFSRLFRAPILDRSETDPYSLSYPAVRPDLGGYTMWYGSTVAWGEGAAGTTHVLKRARSTDALSWAPTGEVCLGASPGEPLLARPSVLCEDGYRMWLSCRGPHYRIGYAESADGVRWRRLDARYGLTPSGQGWDGEAVAYPYAFRHRGRLYLLYSGNGYGRTGMGLAVLDEPAAGGGPAPVEGTGSQR
jgi:hypothetical protein